MLRLYCPSLSANQSPVSTAGQATINKHTSGTTVASTTSRHLHAAHARQCRRQTHELPPFPSVTSVPCSSLFRLFFLLSTTTTPCPSSVRSHLPAPLTTHLIYPSPCDRRSLFPAPPHRLFHDPPNDLPPITPPLPPSSVFPLHYPLPSSTDSSCRLVTWSSHKSVDR